MIIETQMIIQIIFLNIKQLYNIIRNGDIMKLTSDVVKKISSIKNEDEWVLDFRLKSLDAFNNFEMPKFGPDINIDFDKMISVNKV